MSTFGDIRTQVEVNLGRNDSATQAMILTAYNSVIEMMNAEQEWEELVAKDSFPLVIDQLDYDLATLLPETTRVRRILSAWLVDGDLVYQPMRQYTETKWEEVAQVTNNITSHQPTGFVVYRRTMTFNTKPNKAYECHVRYQFKAQLAVDVTSPNDFEDKDSVIIATTTAIVWTMLEEEKNASMWFKLASALGGTLSKDNSRIVNLKSASSSSLSPRSGQTWADPFRNKNN